MSRAFVKEDVDEPEPSGRSRAASGLPPGALNYLTARGAAQLRADAARLRASGQPDAAAEIDAILASATVVEPPACAPESVTFGATVSVLTATGVAESFRIVGVDEVHLEQGNLSWVSPLGRALLGAELGSLVSLDGGRPTAKVIRIEHR